MESGEYGDERYHLRLAAAYALGRARRDPSLGLPAALAASAIEDLTEPQLREVVERARTAGLRLHRFKRTMGLARVERVLGILRGLAPADLLDVGSGRGVFLWPLLDAFPALLVTGGDRDAGRTEGLQAVRDGGVHRLSVVRASATRLPFPDAAFDVVTCLEVLEHVPDASMAAAEIVRVARRAVVASVPSQPDDNPEHLHLFDVARLVALLRGAGAERVNVDHVLNHRIAVARVER